MKKTLKKLLVSVLAAAMVLGSLTISAAADETTSNTAFLMFSDRNWAYGNWDSTLESATTTVDGAGSYSVTLNLADVKGEATDPVNGAQVFCVDIEGAYTSGHNYTLTDVEVLVDGTAIEMDKTAVKSGDIEEKGNFRIELYNEYGLTAVTDAANVQPFDPLTFTANETITVNFTLEEGAADGYTAFLMFSDRNWAYGNWDANLASATTTVTGAGDYSVTLPLADVKGEATDPVNGAQVFCVYIVGAQAALTEEGKTFKLTNVEVLTDGTAVEGFDASKVLSGDIEGNGNYRIELYNEYGATNAAPLNYTAFTANDTITVNFTLSGVDSTADATAFLMFSDRNWAYGNWDASLASATTTVNGDGTYSVTLPLADVKGEATDPVNGAQVFCVDVVGLSAACADPSTITVSDVEVLVDGAAVEGFNASKVLYGDIEENGNLRIEIYNEYGATNAAPLNYTAFTANDTITVNFSLEVVDAEAVEETEVAGVDLDGQYNAYLCFQTPAYSFRNNFDEPNYGRDTAYFYQVTGWDADGNAIVKDGTFTDAVIAGNGTYTVSVDGLDLEGDFDSQEYMNIIYLSTDIPNSGEITISDVSLKVDGKSVDLPAESQNLNEESKEYMQIQLQSIYNSAIKEIGYYNVPMTSMEITFTVSGFNYDKAEEAAPAETETTTTEPTTTETPADDAGESKTNVGLIIGIIAAVAVAAAVVVVVVVNSRKKKA